MNIKLKSGEYYSLHKIFSGINDKIVIPDLQRDYCWGNPDKNLVSKFLDTMFVLDKEQKWPMGLIYGYTDSLYSEHIQLCDGQQRLTTLFLVVGIINRLLPGNKYKHLLISDFEYEQDDQEPYLQYAIRESSLYFLSDLTCHYFLNAEEIESVDKIPEQPWYLGIYRKDPTVKSILNAVKLIEERLSGRNDLEELGRFVTNNMEFMFYDMENRANGEETFVVINTSGEPLTANQNLKPKIIKEYQETYPKIANKWEQMETWFWQNRNRDEKIPHTSDEGMAEFMRCVMMLKHYQLTGKVEFVEDGREFPYKDIDFVELRRYFIAYKLMYTTDYHERYDKQPKYTYSQETLFAILPTLQYCYKYIGCAKQIDVKRLYHFFCNLSRYVDLSRPAGPVGTALALVNSMNDKDVVCLKENQALRDREEERRKLALLADANNRENMELLFAQAENNNIFNGQIIILLQWANNNMDSVRHYLNRVEELWHDNCDGNIDTLRRALLTRGLKDYPLDVPNRSHLTLGSEWKQWYKIFENNVESIKAFLDDQQSMQDMIDGFSDGSSPYYCIIKDAEILQKSRRKNLRLGWNDIVIVMEKERSIADFLIIFNGVYYPKDLMPSGWNYLWEYCGVLYTDHLKYDLTIDYIFEKGIGFRVEIWSGKYKNKKKYPNLSNISELGLQRIENKGEECWVTEYLEDPNKAKEKLVKIANWVVEK